MSHEKINNFEVLYKKEWDAYLHSLYDKKMKWYHLERLHILSQLSFMKHLSIHWIMLHEAWYDKNIYEMLGQFLRLVLVAPGHIFQRLPIGNIGTTRVPVFLPMTIPKEFEHLFNKK